MSIFKRIGNLFSKKESQITSNHHSVGNSINEEVVLATEKLELNRIINDGDLSPEEILMLALTSEMDTSKNSFPGYWQYSYNVNPQILFTKLIGRGFYTKEKSLLVTLERKTVEELKGILRKYNLKVSGKKQVLIERILEELNDEQLNSIELIEVYKINDKAQEILNTNDHILFFHNYSMEISIYEAHDFKNKNPHYSPVEIARHLIGIKSERHVTNGDWGLYRSSRLSLAEIEMKNQNLEKALVLIFEVCYLDLSGLWNNFNLDYLYIYEQNFFPYENSTQKIAPGVVNYIKRLKVKLGLSDTDLKQMYLKSMDKYQLPFHLFTKDESADILIAEINFDEAKLKNIYKIAEKRYITK